MIEFLQKVLHSDEFEILPLAGDASDRRYHRVIADERSWVLMQWEPFQDDGTYPFLSVHRHFEKHLVQVPEIVEISPPEGLVLLEDLGDLTLERQFWEKQNQEIILPFYVKAIDELLKINFTASDDRIPCTAFNTVFDTKKLVWEMNFARKQLMQSLCQISLSDIENKTLEENFLKICEILDRQPRYICHRDYHSRNLMIKLGKMRVIDFQDARLGPIQYDLVSLLRDSYVDLSPESEQKMIRYYQDCQPHSKPISLDEYMRIFEIQTIQRSFKACGSFASFYNLRNDRRYLKYLSPAIQYVRRSLLLFPEYKPIYDILEGHGLFLERGESDWALTNQ